MSAEEWRTRVRDFARQEVAHRVIAMDRGGYLDPELNKALFAEGLMSVEIPAHYGGQGRPFTDAVATIEEISRVCPGVGVAVDVHNILVAGSVLRAGDGDQRRRYLPRLAREVTGAFAISEEQAGSDVFALRTTAEPDGRDFRLSGTKKWTSNAAVAGVFCVFAKTGEDITAFLVERDAAGLRVGEPNEQMGMRAARTADVVLDGVRVRRQHILGGLGQGETLGVTGLALGRIGIAAQLVGLARGAIDVAAGYVTRRSQFGRPVSDYQGVQFPLAASAAQTEAASALTYAAAEAVSAGVPLSEQLRLSAMAKYTASQAAQTAATRAVDALGGNGTLPENRAEKFYRDAKIGTIYEGTTNILLQIIAGDLLRRHTNQGTRL